jgi:hypothetical protein
MRNIMALFAGAVVGFFVILVVAFALSVSSGRFSMDGAPAWPLLIAVPVGVGIGYVVGKKVSAPKND